MDRITRQEIIEDTEDLNNIINQLNLIDICRTHHPTTAEYKFFSKAHGTFSRMNLVSVYKRLNKLKRI